MDKQIREICETLAEGPLARVELGQNKVQGLDYYYTLHGWLKGVNTPGSATNDMGQDGNRQLANNLNKFFAKDQMAFGLGYYEGDYKAIRPANAPLQLAATQNWSDLSTFIKQGQGTTQLGLFNGNIAWMVTDIDHFKKTPLFGNPRATYVTGVNAMVYQYDQLNRLVQTRNRLTYTTNFATASADNFYDENYSYDKNGNILTLSRNGSQKPTITSPHTPMQIDDFEYNYNFDAPINGRLINNRLRGVHEQNALPSPGPDIRRIQGSAYDANTTDYEYDEIGNLIKDHAEGITDIKWNVYGKITDIDFTDPARSDLSFEYDATGNRIAKTVKQGQNQLSWITTLYERDASGNVMATYERTYATDPSGYVIETTKLIELPIYGSSRVGIRTETQVANTAEIKIGGYESDGRFIINGRNNAPEHNSDLTASLFTRSYGYKNYELSNHLGNVLATITDWKKPSAGLSLSAQTATEYVAQVSSATDYYPGGMLMPGRQYNSGTGYAYGFNGKLMDNEVSGNGNQYDYGFRIYDPRLIRFKSVDPLTAKFAFYTPYQFAGNSPIAMIDLDGLEAMLVTIRPVPDAPELKQVNVSKIKAQAEQSNLTVTYRVLDADGNTVSETTFDSYQQGSVEQQLATATNAEGVSASSRLQAGTYNANGSFTLNTIQDPESNTGSTQTRALNGFQYDLDIKYKPDGCAITENDLASGTLGDVNTQIENAKSTLSSVFPFTGLNGVTSTVDLKNFNITVVGETDGTPSNHTATTSPNDKPRGNPALAQDRANNVKASLGNMNGRDVKTSTVNNTGGASQQNRKTKLNITPPTR